MPPPYFKHSARFWLSRSAPEASAHAAGPTPPCPAVSYTRESALKPGIDIAVLPVVSKPSGVGGVLGVAAGYKALGPSRSATAGASFAASAPADRHPPPSMRAFSALEPTVEPAIDPSTDVSILRSVSEQLGVGGVLGVAAGYASRRLGRAALMAVGTEVIVLQYFATRGWVTVHWGRVGEDLRPTAGPGGIAAGMKEILLYKLPFTAAFSAGLAAGLRI